MQQSLHEALKLANRQVPVASELHVAAIHEFSAAHMQGDPEIIDQAFHIVMDRYGAYLDLMGTVISLQRRIQDEEDA